MDEDNGERLREAACIGDIAMVSKLQSQGVDLNSKNKMNGWTAMHWACKRNHETIVKHLLDSGANKDILNNDEQTPAQLSSNQNIKSMLGASQTEEVKDSSLPISFTPNYLANPPFPYATNNRDERGLRDYMNQFQQQNPPAPPTGDQRRMLSAGDTMQRPYSTIDQDELVLKARLAYSDDKDFIEVELSYSTLDYTSLLNLICVELGVDKKLVSKIRKLPDTIVRKDKDVRRLVNFQELELVLTNKAASAASRAYCIAPVRNTETILDQSGTTVQDITVQY